MGEFIKNQCGRIILILLLDPAVPPSAIISLVSFSKDNNVGDVGAHRAFQVGRDSKSTHLTSIEVSFYAQREG